MTIYFDNRAAHGKQMSTPLLILVTLIYAYVAAEFMWYGNKEMCIVYTGYAIANIGFVMIAKKIVKQ